MGIYLKAKHWQLFVVLVGAMFVVQSISFSSTTSHGVPGTVSFVIPIAIFLLLYVGWLWAVADACSKALPPELASSPLVCKVALTYAFGYFIVSSVFFFGLGNAPNTIFVMLHLLSIAAIFYALGFTAKQLTKLDQGKDMTFYAYSGPFFLLWFFQLVFGLYSPR